VKLAEASKPKVEPNKPEAAKKAEETGKKTDSATKADDSSKKAATLKKEEAADDKAPSRHWVQLASASDALAVSEYKRLKAKAPKLLADTTGYKAAFRSTNRVLVGPFKDQKEAQALVNALAKASIDAVPWTSAEGQEIEKLPGK